MDMIVNINISQHSGKPSASFQPVPALGGLHAGGVGVALLQGLVEGLRDAAEFIEATRAWGLTTPSREV